MDKPRIIKGTLALWYSPGESGYYWQDDYGWGDKTSKIYGTMDDAIKAYSENTIKLED